MVSFATMWVYLFILWACINQVVKYYFYKELHKEIIKVDQQVQLERGLPF